MAYGITVFLYIDVKQMNLSEGSVIEVEYCRVVEGFIPLCWVYVSI